MKFTYFIFFAFIIINAFSYPTLKKYDSLKTNEKFIFFESGDFSDGDKMYFEIKTEGYIAGISNFLYYEYYDNVESVVEDRYLKYYTKSSSRSSTSINGVETSSTSYFTITKKAGELDDTNGKYLLLSYGCIGQYKIENTESDGSTKIIIIIIIVFCVFVVIFIVLAVACVICFRKRRRMMMMSNPVPVVPYGPYYQPQVLPYGQMPNNQVIYQNPQPVYLSPQNVQVAQNGVAPIVQPSSQRNVAPQTQAFEKPH
jgi:hypothetical protein